jgi:hypothetical protein
MSLYRAHTRTRRPSLPPTRRAPAPCTPSPAAPPPPRTPAPSERMSPSRPISRLSEAVRWMQSTSVPHHRARSHTPVEPKGPQTDPRPRLAPAPPVRLRCTAPSPELLRDLAEISQDASTTHACPSSIWQAEIVNAEAEAPLAMAALAPMALAAPVSIAPAPLAPEPLAPAPAAPAAEIAVVAPVPPVFDAPVA